MDNRYIEPPLTIDVLRPKIVAPPPSFEPTETAANFILVKLVPGAEEKTIMELGGIDGINGIHRVYGEYDLVLIVREKSEMDRHSLMWDIRAIRGVIDVQTLLAAS